MNILFLFIGAFKSIEQHEIYPDLVRKVASEGHHAYVLCSNERRTGRPTELVQQNNVSIVRVRIGNITKCNLLEKGISTLLIERQYKQAIKKYFGDVKFDMVTYATPPITLEPVVRFIKKRDGATSYLMLKDIFPQNAVDISLLSTSGIKGLLHRFFRFKEKRLYQVSDHIGCMSPANCEYLLTHNPEIAPEKIELCPNCFEIREKILSSDEIISIRDKYGIPRDSIVLVYGGNLGKPQGIPFLIECMTRQKHNTKVFFLIVGGGTEEKTIQDAIVSEKLVNALHISVLPTEEFECVIAACDIGLIYLDHRFTIPNFPSRILSYMQAKLPVIACTDVNTDVKELVLGRDFGWWCESCDGEAFDRIIAEALSSDLKQKGRNAFATLREKYSISVAYQALIKHL